MHCATLQALTFAPRRTFLRPVPALLLSSTFFFAPLASAQSLRNSQFQVAYSPSGVTSLKHVQDKYDTDYVAAGRTLGDLLIRYRSVGAKDWRNASAATLDTNSPQQDSVGFNVGEVLPTIATSARASSSVRSPAVFALNDLLLPENSHDTNLPRFMWFGRKGTTEWVQYDFPEPKQVRSVQVYWAVQDDENNPCKVPKSWRVLYLEGADWKEVNSPSSYGVAAD